MELLNNQTKQGNKMTTTEIEQGSGEFDNGRVKELTAAELQQGYVLDSNGVVVFDPNTTLDRHGLVRTSVTMGRERQMTLPGLKPVAEIRVGDLEGGSIGGADRVTILDDVNGHVFVSVEGTDVYEELRTSSEEYDGFLVGRSVPGQETLDDGVSREHCIIALTEDGKIVVQNLQPTNSTAIRGFGNAPRTHVAQ